MSEKKQESFTVTDRRLFTSEGELRREVSEEEVSTSKPASPAAAETNVTLDCSRAFRAGSVGAAGTRSLGAAASHRG